MFLLRYTDWSVVLKVILTMFLSFSIICLVVTIMIYISLWGLFQQESIRFPFQHKRAFIVLNIAFNAIIVKILWIIKLFFQGMQVSDSRQNITLTALILLFEVLVYLWCFVLQLLRFFLHKYHVFAAKYDVFKMGVTFMVTNLSGIAITGIAIIIGYYEQNKKLYSDVFLNSSKILICVVYIILVIGLIFVAAFVIYSQMHFVTVEMPIDYSWKEVCGRVWKRENCRNTVILTLILTFLLGIDIGKSFCGDAKVSECLYGLLFCIQVSIFMQELGLQMWFAHTWFHFVLCCR